MPKRKDDALTDSLKELATIQNDRSSLNTNSSDSRGRNSVSFENFVHRFEHWLLRDPTARHVLDYLCKVSPYLNRRVWLHGPGFPVPANHLSNALFTTQFAQGFDFVIQVIWPLAFAGLITHDLILYSQEPDERFGNTVPQIFSGESSNQATWSTEFGTDFVTQYQNWLPLSVIFATPLLGGLALWLSRLHWRHSLVENILSLKITPDDRLAIQQLLQNASPGEIVDPEFKQILFQDYDSANSFQEILRKQGFSISEMQNSSNYVVDLAIDDYIKLQSIASFSKLVINTQQREDNNCNNQTREALEIAVDNDTAAQETNLLLKRPEAENFEVYYKNQRARLSWMLLWDGQLCDKNRLEITRIVSNLARKGIQLLKSGKLISLYDMSTLADLADSFSQADFIHAQNNRDSVSLQKIKEEALAALETIASSDPPYLERKTSWLRYIYANYLLWTLGQAQSAAWNAAFASLEIMRRGVVGYTAFRFIQSLANKFIDLSDYIDDKNSCENSGGIWSLVPSTANYDCQMCDGPYSNYANSLDAQSCLDGLLSQPRSAGEILQALPSLLAHPNNVVKVDLSQQDWTHWTEEEWDEFLVDLSPLKGLEVLNLSQTVMSPVSVEGKIANLANFLRDFNVTRFDIHNQNIGPEQTSLLIPTLAEAGVMYADLSGNNMGDSSAVTLGQSLPGSDFRELNLSNNNLSDWGVGEIATYVPNCTVTTVYFSGNNLSGASLDAIANVLENSQLNEIDWSSNDLSAANFTQWGQKQQLSHLETVSFANCQLRDSTLVTYFAYLKNSALTSLDISGNDITQESMYSLCEELPATNITTVNVSSNSITDAGISAIAQTLTNPNTPLKTLDISASNLSTEGFTELCAALPQSNLESLIAQNNGIDDAGAQAIAQALQNTTTPLRTLNLANNRITAQGGAQIFRSLLNAPLERLYIQNNNIENSISVLAEIIEDTNLQELDVSNNEINGENFNPLAARLPYTQLTVLRAANNPLGEEVGFTIASVLVTDTPRSDQLKMKNVERDELRALHAAQSTTPLNKLDLSGTQQSTQVARWLCRELGNTEIPLNQFNISNNPIDPNEVDDSTCRVSFATRLTPGLTPHGVFSCTGTLQTILLFFWLYRILQPMSMAFACSVQGMFAKRHSDQPNNPENSLNPINSMQPN